MDSSSAAAPGIRKKKPKPWNEVRQPSKNVLRNCMMQMYWLGVRREIVLLIRTLRAWQQERYDGVQGDDEVLQVRNMEGFKAFLERAVGKGRSEHEYVWLNLNHYIDGQGRRAEARIQEEFNTRDNL
jgi:hypothetical protein